MNFWSVAVATVCLGLSVYQYAIKKDAPQATLVLGLGLSMLGKSSDIFLLAGTVLVVLGAAAILLRIAKNGNGVQR